MATQFLTKCQRLLQLHALKDKYLPLAYVSQAAHTEPNPEKALQLISDDHNKEYGFVLPFIRIQSKQ